MKDVGYDGDAGEYAQSLDVFAILGWEEEWLRQGRHVPYRLDPWRHASRSPQLSDGKSESCKAGSSDARS